MWSQLRVFVSHPNHLSKAGEEAGKLVLCSHKISLSRAAAFRGRRSGSLAEERRSNRFLKYPDGKSSFRSQVYRFPDSVSSEVMFYAQEPTAKDPKDCSWLQLCQRCGTFILLSSHAGPLIRGPCFHKTRTVASVIGLVLLVVAAKTFDLRSLGGGAAVCCPLSLALRSKTVFGRDMITGDTEC